MIGQHSPGDVLTEDSGQELIPDSPDLSLSGIVESRNKDVVSDKDTETHQRNLKCENVKKNILQRL